MKNKSEKVLLHLKKYKKITTWDAIKKYKATRLSAIIFNLKEKGHIINSVTIRNAVDGSKWYVEYRYKGLKKVK